MSQLWVVIVLVAVITLYFWWRRRALSPFPAWLTRLLHTPWRRRAFPPELAAERHGIRDGMRVLEVGSGDGYLTAAAQARAGSGGPGLAVSQSALAAANR